MLPAGDPHTDYLCDFGNRAMATAVHDSFAKLGLPTQGQFADVAGPGPVLLVRLIRNLVAAHPRAAVFLTRDTRMEMRMVVITTYRDDGTIDRSIAHQLTDEEWNAAEPEALPLALQTPTQRRKPKIKRSRK